MSGSVLQELAAPLRDAVQAAGGDGAPVRLDRPADASHGDYATAVALSLAKPLKQSPRTIAEGIAERIESPYIGSAEVAG
ncbi:MAG: Arginyl tRNA synthetase terminal domain, partial [Gaiellales bacterium]|nr:Arginyl tRNA synthetase terminal domain [Gaiellales bacterium]